MQDEAKKDYLSGMKYKDIAEKYEVSINTVKSWKQRNNWQRGPTQKGVHTKNKNGAHKVEKVAPKIIEEISANDELNDQRKLFCLYYLQRFNATWAYMQAYDVDYRTANVNGPRLLGNASVRKQVDKLRDEIASDLMLTADDIAKQYAKQAFSDIGDYVEFKTEMEQVMALYGPMVDKDKNPVMQKRSRVYLKDDEDVDTSLIKSVKVGKDGPVVELYDKQKAMDALMNYVGEKQTLKGQLMQAQIDRLKIQNGDNDPDEDDDDGFLEAIDKSAKDVWSDE
ncbi:terminase small subunit [Latilactobacillus sakei]|uniref:terminase small subunit n=1 Tax=Latilactobacillus sakei TaxID=1599 RepID=UPI0024078344|nr:terminase small subunit [Latilactobacillus sakei]WEY49775.1 terminase small subunit [Latilactobacillus sakei]